MLPGCRLRERMTNAEIRMTNRCPRSFNPARLSALGPSSVPGTHVLAHSPARCKECNVVQENARFFQRVVVDGSQRTLATFRDVVQPFIVRRGPSLHPTRGSAMTCRSAPPCNVPQARRNLLALSAAKGQGPMAGRKTIWNGVERFGRSPSARPVHAGRRRMQPNATPCTFGELDFQTTRNRPMQPIQQNPTDCSVSKKNSPKRPRLRAAGRHRVRWPGRPRPPKRFPRTAASL